MRTVVGLGVASAVVASSMTFAASTPRRAYGEVIPPAYDAASVVDTPTADTTATAEATTTVVTSGTVDASGTTVAAATPTPSATKPAAAPLVLVPSVLGKTKSTAVKRLKARKFKVRVTRVYTTKKSGTVVGQSPVKKRRASGSTVKIKVAKRWPNGFSSKAKSDRFWRPYVVACYKKVDRNRKYRGSYRVNTTANVNMTLRAIWGESRGNPRAGLTHHDGYLGLLQMDKGYGSKTKRLDPIYSIKRMGRGIKAKGPGWARSRWSTI